MCASFDESYDAGEGKMLPGTFQYEIDGQEQKGDGKRQQGHGAAIPQRAFAVTKEARDDAADKTDTGGN
jgi:hypothetical protein